MKKRRKKIDSVRLKYMPANAIGTKLLCYFYENASDKYIIVSYNDLAKRFNCNKSNICRIIRYLVKLKIIDKKTKQVGNITYENKYKYMGL